MSDMLEIMNKIRNNTATSEDFERLSALSKEKAAEKKNAESSVLPLIESIKAANVDPQLLTNLLAKESLIVIPTPKSKEKIVIFQESVKTRIGRDSTFKVWVGRNMKQLTGSTKLHWSRIKSKQMDYFIKNLTEEGKKYYETEEGKKWIKSLFKN